MYVVDLVKFLPVEMAICVFEYAIYFYKSSTTAEHSERPFSTLETRSRISPFQSHASRRDQEFLPFSLMLRDENENLFLSVSCFEARSRVSVSRFRASRRE